MEEKPEVKPVCFKRKREVFIAVAGLCTGFLLGGSLMESTHGQRPQLDLKNTGKSSVLLRFAEGDVVLSPGQKGSGRFSPGGSIAVFAGATDAAKSKSFSFRDKWIIIEAEVNADDPEQIDIRYTSVR